MGFAYQPQRAGVRFIVYKRRLMVCLTQTKSYQLDSAIFPLKFDMIPAARNSFPPLLRGDQGGLRYRERVPTFFDSATVPTGHSRVLARDQRRKSQPPPFRKLPPSALLPRYRSAASVAPLGKGEKYQGSLELRASLAVGITPSVSDQASPVRNDPRKRRCSTIISTKSEPRHERPAADDECIFESFRAI